MNSTPSIMAFDMTDKKVVEFILRAAYGTRCAFSNPKEKCDEALSKYKKISEVFSGHKIQISSGLKRIVFEDMEGRIIDIVKEKADNPHLTRTVEEETVAFKNAVKLLRNNSKEVGIMRYDTGMRLYATMTTDEFLLKMEILAGNPPFHLRKENIRTWRWGEQKYYRLTFTGTPFVDFSTIEKAFGHDIIGDTILMTKEHYKVCKKMIRENYLIGDE